jgi:dTMP kinase
VVICDRFYHSTLAYQGHGRGLGMELVEAVNDIATQGLKPHLTILLDIDAQQGLSRKKRSDRFEHEDFDFHQRVRQAYLGMAQEDPQRWLVINATLDERDIEGLIWEWVEQLLPAMRKLAKLPEAAQEVDQAPDKTKAEKPKKRSKKRVAKKK